MVMLESWRGWAGDLSMVLRRSWRAITAVLLVTMVLPVLPVSGLIAVGVAVGAALSLNGQDSGIIVALAAVTAPFLVALVVGCTLVVARGWTGAVWAAASAASGKSAGVSDALHLSRRRSGRLWGCYLAGVAVLAGGAFLAGHAAPQAFAVPDLLVLAGPAGLLAPVLCFAPAAAWRHHSPGAGEPPAIGGLPGSTGSRAHLAPMAVVLAVVIGGEAAAALCLSWLMTSPFATGVGIDGINGPAAVLIASVVALPGSVLLAAATSLFVFGRAARV
jgi:hypothetical protein